MWNKTFHPPVRQICIKILSPWHWTSCSINIKLSLLSRSLQSLEKIQFIIRDYAPSQQETQWYSNRDHGERSQEKHHTAHAAVTSVMSDSVQTHRWQPTRLPLPWDSPGKNTGVGCHFLLQRMKVKSESEVAQSCLTLPYPMDCSLPGSSAHGIFQARALEWGHCLLWYRTQDGANME